MQIGYQLLCSDTVLGNIEDSVVAGLSSWSNRAEKKARDSRDLEAGSAVRVWAQVNTIRVQIPFKCNHHQLSYQLEARAQRCPGRLTQQLAQQLPAGLSAAPTSSQAHRCCWQSRELPPSTYLWFSFSC